MAHHWNHCNKEEIVLKNHWQVSKITKVGFDRVYTLKPIKEGNVDNMLKKQGKSAIKIDVNRIHRPAMTLSDIEEEIKAKDKVRAWCKEHWERVKEDYNVDGTDAMMMLTHMYPNYRKPS